MLVLLNDAVVQSACWSRFIYSAIGYNDIRKSNDSKNEQAKE
jgi:hypothetical protein